MVFLIPPCFRWVNDSHYTLHSPSFDNRKMAAAEHNHAFKKVLDDLMCAERDEDALDHLLWQHSGLKLYIKYIHCTIQYTKCATIVFFPFSGTHYSPVRWLSKGDKQQELRISSISSIHWDRVDETLLCFSFLSPPFLCLPSSLHNARGLWVNLQWESDHLSNLRRLLLSTNSASSLFLSLSYSFPALSTYN